MKELMVFPKMTRTELRTKHVICKAEGENVGYAASQDVSADVFKHPGCCQKYIFIVCNEQRRRCVQFKNVASRHHNRFRLNSIPSMHIRSEMYVNLTTSAIDTKKII